MFKRIGVVLVVAVLSWPGVAVGQDAGYMKRATDLSLELQFSSHAALHVIIQILCEGQETQVCLGLKNRSNQYAARLDYFNEQFIRLRSMRIGIPKVPASRAQVAAQCRIQAIQRVRPGDARSFIGKGWRDSEVDDLTRLCLEAKGYKSTKVPQQSDPEENQ